MRRGTSRPIANIARVEDAAMMLVRTYLAKGVSQDEAIRCAAVGFVDRENDRATLRLILHNHLNKEAKK